MHGMNKLLSYVFGDFYESESQDKEVTKSLQYLTIILVIFDSHQCNYTKKNLQPPWKNKLGQLRIYRFPLRPFKTTAFAVMKQHSQGLLSLGCWLDGFLRCCLSAFALIAGFCYPWYSHISLAQTNYSIWLK